MRLNNSLLFLLFVIGFFAGACNRVKEVVPAYTQELFPLEPGQSRIYLVIDTTYTTQAVNTDRFYRREVIERQEKDLLGRDIYVIQTYRSEYEFGNNYQWQPERVWSAYKDGQFAERMQENSRYLVLKFPVYRGLRWNGHLYNGRGEQLYKYQSIDTAITVEGVTYDPAVFVMNSLPSDTTSFIKYRLAYTVFAPEKGKVMVYDLTKVKDGPGGAFNPDKSYTHIELLLP